MSNSQARHAAVLQEAADLFAMKNASYQDSWRDQGWRGNVSRVLEKCKRIRALLWRQSVLLNGSKEHPRETLLDIVNTCVFAIINMDDGVEWGEGVDNKPVALPHWSRGAEARQAFPYSNGNQVEEGASGERLGNLPPEGRVVGHTSYGDEVSAHPVGEQTVATPVAGEVPVPGEEKPTPTPRPRVNVTDRGSGPRRAAKKDQ